jgi:hypothetical protein
VSKKEWNIKCVWNFSKKEFDKSTSAVIQGLHGRPVVPVCAGCAMAHPDFGRSVNPIPTRGDRFCPPNYYWHTRIFRPSDGPAWSKFLDKEFEKIYI